MVVTVGRIVPEKRFHVFVDLARLVPETKFVAIGSLSPGNSDYFERLRKNAPANVSFVLSPLRKVRDILGRAQAYIHCAENEHFGITIVEAMAAGCVPVVHDSGGPREIVNDEVGYRWRDLRYAAERIKLLAKSDQLRKKLSVASSLRAEQFGPEIFEKRMTDVICRTSS